MNETNLSTRYETRDHNKARTIAILLHNAGFAVKLYTSQMVVTDLATGTVKAEANPHNPRTILRTDAPNSALADARTTYRETAAQVTSDAVAVKLNITL